MSRESLELHFCSNCQRSSNGITLELLDFQAVSLVEAAVLTTRNPIYCLKLSWLRMWAEIGILTASAAALAMIMFYNISSSKNRKTRLREVTASSSTNSGAKKVQNLGIRIIGTEKFSMCLVPTQ